MKTPNLKSLAIGLALLFVVPVSYARCYKGLDCPEDLWQNVDRYLVKGGLVKDPDTDLMWMRCSLGQTSEGATCQNIETEFSGEQAIKIAKSFNYEGFSDWRLPTREELKTLVYCSSGLIESYKDDATGCKGNFAHPTIVKAVFPNTSAIEFWSSSTSAYDGKSDYLWFVDFNEGYDSYAHQDNTYAVRLVRTER